MAVRAIVRVSEAAPSRLGVLLALLLVGAVVAGLFARWYDLGSRPLAVDEYYTVRSVEFILERGVPEFATGGYYVRGLPLQYIMAAVAGIFGENEWSYRLPSVIFSLISVVLAYFYARRFTSVPVAAAVAGALLVSSWEIEFARFARMYALFQCVTLLFLIAVDATFFGAGRRRYLPHLLAIGAALSHRIGALLSPLLFLPLLPGATAVRMNTWRQRFVFAVITAGTLFLSFLIVTTDFRNWGVTDALPAGFASSGGRSSTWPVFPFWHLPGDPLTTLFLVSALAGAVFGTLWLLRRRGAPITDVEPWLALMLVFSLFHMLLWSGLALAIAVFRYELYRPARHPRRIYALLLVAVLVALAWLGYAAWRPDSLMTDAVRERWDLSEGAILKAFWSVFFGWPDIYLTTLRPFIVELPLLAVLTIAALLVTLIRHGRDPLPRLLRQPWLVIVMTMLLFGLFEPPYSRMRYWFHLYPVILLVIALAIVDLLTWLASRRATAMRSSGALAGLIFLGVFATTSDFNPRHIVQVADAAVAFRTGPFEKFWVTWYWRFDYRSPAEFLNANVMPEDDARIVVQYHFPVSYYLEREHAIYIPRTMGIFVRHSQRQGTLNRWADRPLLSTPQELADHTRTAREVWLIRGVEDEERFPEMPDMEEVWGDRLIEHTRAFLSQDERIEVVRIRLAPPGT